MLTFCISTFNNYDYLYKVIECLKKQKNQNFNVVIQDNTKKSLLKKIDFKSDNVVINTEQCNGLSESRNLSAKICETEYIHFLDDDVLFDSNFSQRVIDSLLKNSECASIGGKITPDWTYASKPSWISNSTLAMLSCVDFGDNIIQYGGNCREASWLVGANLIFKKSIFQEFGEFPLFLGRNSNNVSMLSNEENFLLKKISKSHSVIYDPSICLKHFIKPHQVSNDWMVKRCCWQVISDIISNDQWSDSDLDLDLNIYIDALQKKNFRNLDEYILLLQSILRVLLK